MNKITRYWNFNTNLDRKHFIRAVHEEDDTNDWTHMEITDRYSEHTHIISRNVLKEFKKQHRAGELWDELQMMFDRNSETIKFTQQFKEEWDE